MLAKTINRVEWLDELGLKGYGLMLYLFRAGAKKKKTTTKKRKRRTKASLETRSNEGQVTVDDKGAVNIAGVHVGQAIQEGDTWKLKPVEGMDLPEVEGGSSKEEFVQILEDMLKEAGFK